MSEGTAEFFGALLDRAEEDLALHHRRVLAGADLVEAALEGRADPEDAGARRRAARLAADLLGWANERAWFLGLGEPTVPFSHACAFFGLNEEAERAKRCGGGALLSLPWNGKLARAAVERYAAGRAGEGGRGSVRPGGPAPRSAGAEDGAARPGGVPGPDLPREPGEGGVRGAQEAGREAEAPAEVVDSEAQGDGVPGGGDRPPGDDWDFLR